MAGRCPSVHGTFFDSMLNFWVEWQINILMITTMMLQIFLVIAGFFRKHTSNPALHGCTWISFIILDTCAVYALGLMLASGCDHVFSLYAPILLFHLSASDSINAYAATDNDLWRRYGLKMSLEVVAAAYIVSRSTECPAFTRSGALLFVVGTFRYGERIWALCSGSFSQVLASGRPIFRYMDLYGLDLIVAGEQAWYEHYTKHPEVPDIGNVSELVTYRDVKKCRNLLRLMGCGIIENLCLAYALFKIFRRHLTNLHIHKKEEDYDKVSRILTELKPAQIRNVIDLELSFIFDSVFSKAASETIYQGFGVMLRFVCVILLIAAIMELIDVDSGRFKCMGLTSIPFAVGLANILVVAALVIECIQIHKIVKSNWLRVCLACGYVVEERIVAGIDLNNNKPSFKRNIHVGLRRMVALGIRFAGKPKSTHWNFKLEQLSVMIDTLDLIKKRYLLDFQIGSFFDVQELQLELTNILTEVDMDELLNHLVQKMVNKYRYTRKLQIADFKMKLCELLKNNLMKKMKSFNDSEGADSSNVGMNEDLFTEDTDVEDTVLQCHQYTSVFEIMLLGLKDYHTICDNVDLKVCIWLSRYCMYLMIKRSQLMPGDSDVTKVHYWEMKDEIQEMFNSNHKMEDMKMRLIEGSEDRNGLQAMGFALRMFRDYEHRSDFKDRLLKHGKKLAEVWVDILIYIVMITESANPYIEQMGKGGDLLIHLWVLQRHLAPRQGVWINPEDSPEMVEAFYKMNKD